VSDTPINLNKVRKARARVAAKAQAEANVVAFGRGKLRTAAEREAAARAVRRLDGKALTRGADDGDEPA